MAVLTKLLDVLRTVDSGLETASEPSEVYLRAIRYLSAAYGEETLSLKI